MIPAAYRIRVFRELHRMNETWHQQSSEPSRIADLLGHHAFGGLLLKLATAVATHNVAQATARGGCVKLCAERVELLNGLRKGTEVLARPIGPSILPIPALFARFQSTAKPGACNAVIRAWFLITWLFIQASAFSTRERPCSPPNSLPRRRRAAAA